MDARVHQNKYQVGDVVYMTDSATKVGQFSKLCSPQKEPYLITQVSFPFLMEVQDGKCEDSVHHDQLKLCHDRSLALWMGQLCHGLLMKTPDLAGDVDPDQTDPAKQVRLLNASPVDSHVTKVDDDMLLNNNEAPVDEDLGLSIQFAESENELSHSVIMGGRSGLDSDQDTKCPEQMISPPVTQV